MALWWNEWSIGACVQRAFKSIYVAIRAIVAFDALSWKSWTRRMTVFKLFDNSAALCKWSFQKESISSHFNSDLLPTNRRRWCSFCLSLIQTYFHRRGFSILARRSIIRKDYKRMNNKNDEICARIFRRSRAGWGWRWGWRSRERLRKLLWFVSRTVLNPFLSFRSNIVA